MGDCIELLFGKSSLWRNSNIIIEFQFQPGKLIRWHLFCWIWFEKGILNDFKLELFEIHHNNPKIFMLVRLCLSSACTYAACLFSRRLLGTIFRPRVLFRSLSSNYSFLSFFFYAILDKVINILSLKHHFLLYVIFYIL